MKKLLSLLHESHNLLSEIQLYDEIIGEDWDKIQDLRERIFQCLEEDVGGQMDVPEHWDRDWIGEKIWSENLKVRAVRVSTPKENKHNIYVQWKTGCTPPYEETCLKPGKQFTYDGMGEFPLDSLTKRYKVGDKLKVEISFGGDLFTPYNLTPAREALNAIKNSVHDEETFVVIADSLTILLEDLIDKKEKDREVIQYLFRPPKER